MYLKGDVQGAIAELEKAAQHDDDPEITALLGAAWAKAGDQAKANDCLKQLEQIGQRKYVRNVSFHRFSTRRSGDKNSALNYLEKAADGGETPDTTWLKVDPLFDPLRDEPRFQKLVAKLFPDK